MTQGDGLPITPKEAVTAVIEAAKCGGDARLAKIANTHAAGDLLSALQRAGYELRAIA